MIKENSSRRSLSEWSRPLKRVFVCEIRRGPGFDSRLSHLMPFTHFHLGPAILFGLIFLKKIDFPTFIAANLIIDWRAALVFLGLWSGPRHSWVHTYLGAFFMASLLAGVMIYIRPFFQGFLEDMRIGQDFNLKSIVLAAYSGVFLHITIDAFHHPTMQPFIPFDWKPLYGIFSTTEMRLFCLACLLLSFPVYLTYIYSRADIKHVSSFDS